MMNTTSMSDSHGNRPEVAVDTRRWSMIEEYFLRFLVVALGILIGAIFALFVGLFTGWIEIRC